MRSGAFGYAKPMSARRWKRASGCFAANANELEGADGFSIRRVICISRVKYEKYIPGLRILFFSIPLKACVYVTGVHARADLGVGREYDFSRAAFARAQRYWGIRKHLC
jgi:hypothetical protein